MLRGTSYNKGKKSHACTWYEQVLEVRKKIQGPAASDTLQMVYEMADLFEQMGRKAKAKKWRQEAILAERKTRSDY